MTLGPVLLVENWRLPTRGSVVIFASHQPLPPEFPDQIAAARLDIAGQLCEPLAREDDHQRLMLTAHDDRHGVASFFDLAPSLPSG